MLNSNPIWKYFLIAIILGLGVIYAMPNLYPDDYAVQITSAQSATSLDESYIEKVRTALDGGGIEAKSIEIDGKMLLVKLHDAEQQLASKSILGAAFSSSDYIVALNMAASTPDWLKSLGAGPMKLGLDLRGGVHFLLEVDMEKALSQRMKMTESGLKSELRTEKIRYRAAELIGMDTLRIKFKKETDRDQANALIAKSYREFVREKSEEEDAFYLTITMSEQSIKEIEDYAIQQNLVTLRNRVNELGVAEPLVQRQGRNRIVVELPGVQDTATAKRIIGKTANLEYRLEARAGAGSLSTQTFSFKSTPGRTAVLENDIIVTGSNVSDASASFDENGMPMVNISLDGKGGKSMLETTKRSLKRRMAVVFIEQKPEIVRVMVDGKLVEKRKNKEVRSIISLATIQGVFSNRFQISGLDSPAEAAELALLLRAGSLAAPIYFVEERTVGPSLGQQNIDAGLLSVQIGFALVMIFMLLYYRVFGVIANIALAVNVVLLCALMSMISATLTLPGIAGIVLTVGMAVDANVLIFARIREELANGLTPQQAIDAGYGRAFVAIFDANITTLIAAVILFAVGTGPVKGFAITLSLGILTSLFTAIVLSRMITNFIYGGRKVTTLSIG
jgi:preprotein translocase subunit SecD